MSDSPPSQPDTVPLPSSEPIADASSPPSSSEPTQPSSPPPSNDLHGDSESEGDAAIPVRGGGGGDDDNADSRPSKKSRRSQFVDDIAEDEDDPDANDDDEDFDEDDEDEDIDAEVRQLIDDGEGELGSSTKGKRRIGRMGVEVDEDDTLHLTLDQQRNQQEAESLVKELEEKYGDAEDQVYGDDELYGDDYDEARRGKGALLPSVKDPKLWCLRCDPGKEEEMVFALLKKYLFKESAPNDRLYIKSAFTHPACKGYIYVEADKESHVKSAIFGLRAIKWWSAKLVPIAEMVTAVKFTDKIITVKKGQWVRMKRGVYASDLAKVVDTQDQGTIITVKMIPRIDIAAMEEARRNPQQGKRKRSTLRPPQKLFDGNEIRELGGQVSQSSSLRFRSFQQFNGNRYKNGFLHKEFKVDAMETEDVVPTSDEIERFQQRLPGDFAEDDDEDDEDVEMTSAEKSNSLKPKATFVMSDHVIVTRGAMKNITGRIKSLSKTTAVIQPDPNQPINIDVEVQLDELRKFFKLGDHVKVISGLYKDETGLLIQIGTRDNPNEDALTLYSDVSQREVRVSTGEVVESSEVSSGRDSLGSYDLYDLVQVSGDTVGVIVKVEVASFKVLTTRGIVQTIRLQEIGQRRHSKFAVALDAQSNQVVKDDVVNVLLGPHQGKRGTVKHIHRSAIFLFNRQYSENSGIFVVQARHIALVGQYQQLTDLTKGMKSPQVMGGFGSKSPHPSLSSGTTPGAPSAPINRLRPQRDPLIGKTVNIIRGQYKSYIGVVQEANDQSVRVELLALARKVAIPREYVVDRSSRPAPFAPSDGQRGLLGSETPLLGSRTPAYDYGGATPAHEFAGGMTPSRNYDDFGSRTPSHSSESDVWASQTPHHSSIPEGEEEEDELERKFSSARTPITPSVRTPSGDFDDVKTPNPLTPMTPMTPRTPITPGGRVPITPNNPNTPSMDGEEGVGEDVSADSIRWPVGSRIRCPPKKPNGPEVLGTVMKVLQSGTLKVHYDGDPKSVQKNLSPSDVRGPVVPEQEDHIVVVEGPSVGQTGQLVGLNAGEAIVNIGVDILILELKVLCKFDPNVEKK